MFAIGFGLMLFSVITYELLGMQNRGIDGWRAHIVYGSFCAAVLLMFIGASVWLWRVMP